MSVTSAGFSLPLLGRVTVGGLVAGIILGVILAPQVRQLPGINKLPTL
jgi:hypothetical protein